MQLCHRNCGSSSYLPSRGIASVGGMMYLLGKWQNKFNVPFYQYLAACRKVFAMSEYKEKIYAELREVIDNDEIDITDQMPLIGDGSVLDSMKVVSLCIALEDVAADLGFEFDWTSNAAMSRSRSMFRTVGSLVDEFAKQMKAQQ